MDEIFDLAKTIGEKINDLSELKTYIDAENALFADYDASNYYAKYRSFKPDDFFQDEVIKNYISTKSKMKDVVKQINSLIEYYLPESLTEDDSKKGCGGCSNKCN